MWNFFALLHCWKVASGKNDIFQNQKLQFIFNTTSFGKKCDQQAYLMNQASVFVVLLRVGAQQHEVALQGVEIFELK